MRLCPPVSLCLAAAAALLPAPAYAEVPVPAYAEAGPGCAGSGADGFPLTTRLRGGPDSYRPGGGFGAWYLDLTNTTRRTCDDVHPVVVLVDEAHLLKPDQPRLEFYAGGRQHPVRFELTDDDELVGVFADEHRSGSGGFSGFRVGPGRTLTVKLRLALAAGTAPNVVTANAAVVQRHGDDGDWVGQSNDYRFTVGTAPGTPPETEPGPGTEPGADTGPGTEPGADTGPGTEPGTGKAEPGSGSAAPQTAPPVTPSPRPSAADTGALSLADEAAELARTGLSSPAALGVVGCGFLIVGAALLLARRRR
ncbi:hypothetical protein P1S61_17125 [Streptomyces sp. ME08-AFT2]|nr:hypothetical protein [Streptomyces sp. ME08-AFT2]MDX3310764.1 hypothetical protein [Streptomyces sp. ME08-AFT2]